MGHPGVALGNESLELCEGGATTDGEASSAPP